MVSKEDLLKEVERLTKMVGDTIHCFGEEFEVVWNGGELLPDRETKPPTTWEPPTRIYNKTGMYAAPKRNKSDLWLQSVGLDKDEKEVQAVPLTDEQAKLLED